jgi:hypothetical protein
LRASITGNAAFRVLDISEDDLDAVHVAKRKSQFTMEGGRGFRVVGNGLDRSTQDTAGPVDLFNRQKGRGARVLSTAAAAPVSENSTPTRQLLGCISKSPSEGRCRVWSKAAYRSHLVFSVPPDPKDGFQIWDTQEEARRP